MDTYTYNTSGLAVLNTLDKAETCLTMSACHYTSTSCMSHLLRAKGKYTGGWGRGIISTANFPLDSKQSSINHIETCKDWNSYQVWSDVKLEVFSFGSV